jgi:hypothetical protein
MQLVFTGHPIYLEALVVVLAAPSLQHLDTELTNGLDTYSFPLPHFCKFICNITIGLAWFAWISQLPSSDLPRRRVPNPSMLNLLE